MGISGPSSVIEFYDGLASDYHLIYADRWEQSLRHQGHALDALIRSSLLSHAMSLTARVASAPRRSGWRCSVTA